MGRYGPLRAFKLSLYDINRALDQEILDKEGIKGLVLKEYHDFPRYSRRLWRTSCRHIANRITRSP